MTASTGHRLQVTRMAIVRSGARAVQETMETASLPGYGG